MALDLPLEFSNHWALTKHFISLRNQPKEASFPAQHITMFGHGSITSHLREELQINDCILGKLQCENQAS